MFKTKSDVDKYVGKLMQQKKLYAKGSQEGLKIARAYFDIKEYDSSVNYLASYLSENNDDAQAWRLMGELHESYTKNWPQALDCFIKYYQFNTQATHILLKICNCFNNLNINDNFDRASEWLDKAERFYPFSKEVLDLKEKLFNKNLKNMSQTEWESYLKQACKENPFDEDLRLKLIKFYYSQKEKQDYCYEYVLKSEISGELRFSLNWYENLIELFETLKTNKTQTIENCDIMFGLLLSQKLLLQIQSTKSVNKQDLIKFDRFIEELVDLNDTNILKDELISIAYFIYGLILLNIGDLKFCNICFVTSSLKTHLKSNKIQFISSENKISTLFYKYFQLNWSLRTTQIGLWLLKCSKQDQMSFINCFKATINEEKDLNEKINEKLFNEHKGFLLKTSDFQLLKDDFIFIDLISFKNAEKICLNYQKYNLNFLIWYSLFQKKNLIDVNLFIPNVNIPFGIDNLNLTNRESICLLDMHVFYYASLLQASVSSFNNLYWLTEIQCTKEHLEWWTLTIASFTSKQKFEQKDNQIQKGLDIIRLSRNGIKLIDTKIIILIARYLHSLLKTLEINDEMNDLKPENEQKLSPNERSHYVKLYTIHYWSYIANNLLDGKSKQTLNESFYFKYSSEIDMSKNDIQLARLYLALRKYEQHDLNAVKLIFNQLSKDENKIAPEDVDFFKELFINKLLEDKKLADDDIVDTIMNLIRKPIEFNDDLIQKLIKSPVKEASQQTDNEELTNTLNKSYSFLSAKDDSLYVSISKSNAETDTSDLETSYESKKPIQQKQLAKMEESLKVQPTKTTRKSTSIKLNILRDILKNQFEQINGQVKQLNQEIGNLGKTLNSLKRFQ